MNLLTHISLAMLLTLILYAKTNEVVDTHALNLWLAAAAVGSLLPDIDHPKAYVSKKHWLLHGTSHLIEALAHHRGITHSLLALTALSAAAYGGLRYLQLDGMLALPFAVGYLSHLVADSLNPSGVKWLQPISQKTIKTGKIPLLGIRIETGSLAERLLAITLSAVFLKLYLTTTGINMPL